MTDQLFSDVVDGLSYAIHSAAARRNPNYVKTLLDTRDEFVHEFPDQRENYVPAGER